MNLLGRGGREDNIKNVTMPIFPLSSSFTNMLKLKKKQTKHNQIKSHLCITRFRLTNQPQVKTCLFGILMTRPLNTLTAGRVLITLVRYWW